jgi:hypothetical protein
MSSGYTPVFNGALDGTLYGRWPHTGVWLCLLSQCDRHGCIDMVLRLLAAKIGVSEEVLLACIRDFMEPDPGSRTGDLEGRRLELLDPVNRDWGWRVINHGLYRERARKASYDAARIEDGSNRERMKARNSAKPLDPRKPAVTRDAPPSEADAASNSNKNTERERERLSGSLIGNFELTSERRSVAVARKPPLDPELTHARFVAFHASKGTRNVDWDQAWKLWCLKENGDRGNSTVKRRVAMSTAQLEALEAEEAKDREKIAKAHADFPGDSPEEIWKRTDLSAGRVRELEQLP